MQEALRASVSTKKHFLDIRHKSMFKNEQNNSNDDAKFEQKVVTSLKENSQPFIIDIQEKPLS